jgi:hypothetical protein
MNAGWKILQCAVLVGFGAMAHGATVFNFDADTPGTATAFTDTVDGLSATFSSSADPGGFLVGSSFYATLSGNVLGDPGVAFTPNVTLTIDFSSNLTGLSLLFATSDLGTPSPLTLTTFEGNAQVGSTSVTGTVPNGFLFPEGSIGVLGGPFNRVVVSSTAQFFAVDSIAAAPATVPEPATELLLGVGLVALGMPTLRRTFTR